ncbi:hypothetical protein M422DRAFT_245153 [Sphaerobolus stellatus SS14]|nr:hypothetical protein M422DRAFT_245153 [Sphaerobolus stellatus SS14]
MATGLFTSLQKQLPPEGQLNQNNLVGIFSNATVGYFPPDSTCFPFVDHTYSDLYGATLCPVTPEMISFLNLTNFKNYFNSYCQNPPENDGCPFGWCPNSDIAAPLLRIATYLITLFVTIIVYYEPEALAESFWSQLLTIYSFLITAVIAISKSQLTRIHAVIATGLAASPLTIYLFVYAIRSFWGCADRMRAILGKGHIIPRTLVLIALGLWLALVVYILRPTTKHFTQESCQGQYSPLLFKGFFFLPIVIVMELYRNTSTREIAAILIAIAGLPLGLIIFSWIFAILRRRNEIWPQGEPRIISITRIWRIITDNYPFLQFLAVVVVPLAYWILIMEFGAMVSQDTQFSTSFGQILACFAVLPPFLQVVKMLPRLRWWFIDLRWVRFLTCRPRKRHSEAKGFHYDMLQMPQGSTPTYHVERMGSEGSESFKPHERLPSTASLPSLPYLNTSVGYNTAVR